MTTTQAAASTPPPPPPLPTAHADHHGPAPTGLPEAGARRGTAPLLGNSARLVQIVMFVIGAVLLPVGIVVICLGWYGIAHTPYEYDQLTYLMSGGFLGLGITFVGGFFYFAAWIARVGADLKESDKRLADTLLVLADSIARSSGQAAVASLSGGPRALLVVAGTSTTVHRPDCALLEGRTDLRPVSETAGLTRCRLCQPEG